MNIIYKNVISGLSHPYTDMQNATFHETIIYTLDNILFSYFDNLKIIKSLVPYIKSQDEDYDISDWKKSCPQYDYDMQNKYRQDIHDKLLDSANININYTPYGSAIYSTKVSSVTTAYAEICIDNNNFQNWLKLTGYEKDLYHSILNIKLIFKNEYTNPEVIITYLKHDEKEKEEVKVIYSDSIPFKEIIKMKLYFLNKKFPDELEGLKSLFCIHI